MKNFTIFWKGKVYKELDVHPDQDDMPVHAYMFDLYNNQWMTLQKFGSLGMWEDRNEDEVPGEYKVLRLIL